MKKLFIICTLMVAVLATTASKRNKLKSWQPDYRLEQAFTNRFGNIGNVSWAIVSSILMSASFIDSNISNRPVKAFFDNDGEYLGMTQQTSVADMPGRLASRVRGMLVDYTILEVIEYWNDADNAYYIRAANKSGIKLLKAAVNFEPKFIDAVDL